MSFAATTDKINLLTFREADVPKLKALELFFSESVHIDFELSYSVNEDGGLKNIKFIQKSKIPRTVYGELVYEIVFRPYFYTGQIIYQLWHSFRNIIGVDAPGVSYPARKVGQSFELCDIVLLFSMDSVGNSVVRSVLHYDLKIGETGIHKDHPVRDYKPVDRCKIQEPKLDGLSSKDVTLLEPVAFDMDFKESDKYLDIDIDFTESEYYLYESV